MDNSNKPVEKPVEKPAGKGADKAGSDDEDAGAEGVEWPLGPDGKKISKKEFNKMLKQKKKDELKAKAAEDKKDQPSAKAAAGEDPAIKANYGEYELIQSQEKTDRKWVEVGALAESHIGKEVLVRARYHSSRMVGNLCFVVLRQKCYDVQCIILPTQGKVSKPMIKWISSIPKESIVDVYADVQNPEQPILSCTQKVELKVTKFFIVSKTTAQLPFQLEDASRKMVGPDLEGGEVIPEHLKEDFEKLKLAQEKFAQEKADKIAKGEESKEESKEGPIVSLKTRLDHRTLDLRTKANQAIFRVSSAVCQLFREFLYTQNFIEIHTPKLISGTSEGGANVFKLNYFNQPACLAQSPQLYKQMCVMADFDRVFEIGPVFRAEHSFTPRHMTEFIGLDIEMEIKENYNEVLDLLADMFAYIFAGLETKFAKELAAINEQFPFEPFQYKKPVVKLTFAEGVELLKKHGVEQDPFEDLSTVTEKKLGAIVKEIYGTDFYMLTKYPVNARPFYTMLCKDDPRYTNSYDFFMRGEEITSGAQRIHDSELLAKRAKECGIVVETIKDYIDSFKYGAPPHGGCGIGLERVVMLYCALGNVRKSCLFPRDPKRITP
jgi:aspartyl-tRNA synthetase